MGKTHSPASAFPLALLSAQQVTTLVSSAFLIVKVILSEVSGSGASWSDGHLPRGWASLLQGWGVCFCYSGEEGILFLIICKESSLLASPT